MKRVVVAVTGASGQIYAKSIIDKLAKLSESGEVDFEVIFSIPAKGVWKEETGLEVPKSDECSYIVNNYDFGNRNASGSNCSDSMIIIPCSMGTIGRLAAGTSDTLILRAADVMLKERKKLIIVPRESPFSLIHLRNMTTLTEAGAIIAPASPGFYQKPENMEQMVEIFTDKILDIAGVDSIKKSDRWGD